MHGDAQRRWDASVKKDFRLVEPTRLEFRAAVTNARNTLIYTIPNTTPISSAFGQVTAVGVPRTATGVGHVGAVLQRLRARPVTFFCEARGAQAARAASSVG